LGRQSYAAWLTALCVLALAAAEAEQRGDVVAVRRLLRR
jgi:hypothetical protein